MLKLNAMLTPLDPGSDTIDLRHYVLAFLIVFLWISTQVVAAPPSNERKETLARDNDFLQKALAGKLNCLTEISKRENEILNKHDLQTWQTFGTEQCFRALLKAKEFGTAIQFIESSKRSYLNEWWSLALEEAVDTPIYATDGKCKNGDERYSGDVQDRLMNALINDRDLGEHAPGRRGEIEGVFGRLSILKEYPNCIDNKKLIGWLNKFLDQGLPTTFWWEEPMVVGGLSTFSGVMRLGDVNLAKRILSGGLKQERKFLVYLFARAPNMEMVKLLEKYFKLKKSEYKTVLQIIEAEKKFPESYRKDGAGLAPTDVIDYFKQRAQ